MTLTIIFSSIIFVILFGIASKNLLKIYIIRQVTLESHSKASQDEMKGSEYKNVRNYRFETTENLKIGSWIIKPSVINEQTKYAILIHGNRLNRKEFVKNYGIIEISLKYNIVFMVLDLRGFGDSDGNYDFQAVATDIDVAYTKFFSEYKTRNISIISFSLGGNAALAYLRLRSKDLTLKLKNDKNLLSNKGFFKDYKVPRKLILLAPFISLVDTLEHLTENDAVKRNLLKAVKFNIDHFIGIDFDGDFQFIDETNVYLIYSTKDEYIPVKSIKRLPIQDSRVFEMDDVNHENVINDRAWEKIIEFMNEKTDYC